MNNAEIRALIENLKWRASSWQTWIDDEEDAEFGYSPDNMRHHQRIDNDAAAALESLLAENERLTRVGITGAMAVAERAETLMAQAVNDEILCQDKLKRTEAERDTLKLELEKLRGPK